jgi:SagB-type dehydrogenase family enzyme
MKSKPSRLVCAALSAVLACALLAAAANQDSITLPKPATTGGEPLMALLKNRHSTRELSDRKLPDSVMSDLLWAAWGINRPDSGKRTAPSAKNKQEVDVYVVTADGAYLYDAVDHALKLVATQDLRAQTGGQAFVATAPVNLVYVADYAKSAGGSDEDKLMYGAIATGCIIQNVYLYCTSEGLGTVARAVSGGGELAESLGLRDDQRILMAQTVGYPAK